MAGFLANSRKQGEQFLAQPGDPEQQADVRADIATIDSGKAIYPDVRIVASSEREFAGRRLQIGYSAWSVTAGDLWVYDPVVNLLAAGDLVTLPAPFFDTACPLRWQATLAELDKIPFTTLVPGHGNPMNRMQFTSYRRAFDHLLACAKSPAPKSQCIEGWLTDAASLVVSEQEQNLARGLVDYYLDAVLRGEAGKQAALCGQ